MKNDLYWTVVGAIGCLLLALWIMDYDKKTNIQDQKIANCMRKNLKNIHCDKSYDLVYSWCKSKTVHYGPEQEYSQEEGHGH